MQQSLSGVSKVEELFSIEEILDEALTLMNVDSSKHNVSVKKQYENISEVFHDKSKLMQVLINLIQNAKDSLLESTAAHKTLNIKTGISNNPDYFYIQFIDNGVGIPAENLIKIFSHGFTTKKAGHGFGLHASALAVNEMGGTLQAASEGVGHGAIFTVTLPYKRQ
jgi:signal transduction histidine kinase